MTKAPSHEAVTKQILADLRSNPAALYAPDRGFQRSPAAFFSRRDRGAPGRGLGITAAGDPALTMDITADYSSAVSSPASSSASHRSHRPAATWARSRRTRTVHRPRYPGVRGQGAHDALRTCSSDGISAAALVADPNNCANPAAFAAADPGYIPGRCAFHQYPAIRRQLTQIDPHRAIPRSGPTLKPTPSGHRNLSGLIRDSPARPAPPTDWGKARFRSRTAGRRCVRPGPG